MKLGSNCRDVRGSKGTRRRCSEASGERRASTLAASRSAAKCSRHLLAQRFPTMRGRFSSSHWRITGSSSSTTPARRRLRAAVRRPARGLGQRCGIGAAAARAPARASAAAATGLARLTASRGAGVTGAAVGARGRDAAAFGCFAQARSCAPATAPGSRGSARRLRPQVAQAGGRGRGDLRAGSLVAPQRSYGDAAGGLAASVLGRRTVAWRRAALGAASVSAAPKQRRQRRTRGLGPRELDLLGGRSASRSPASPRCIAAGQRPGVPCTADGRSRNHGVRHRCLRRRAWAAGGVGRRVSLRQRAAPSVVVEQAGWSPLSAPAEPGRRQPASLRAPAAGLRGGFASCPGHGARQNARSSASVDLLRRLLRIDARISSRLLARGSGLLIPHLTLTLHWRPGPRPPAPKRAGIIALRPRLLYSGGTCAPHQRAPHAAVWNRRRTPGHWCCARGVER